MTNDGKGDTIESRGNPYHDPTNGRFTSGGGGKASFDGDKLTDNGKSAIMKVGIENVTGETATISEKKFTEYALNSKKQPDKAFAFKTVLGYDLSNYQLLEKEIRSNFDRSKLTRNGENAQGTKYELIMKIKGVNGRTAKVLTGWIDDTEDQIDFHLTTLHIDE